jgi:hypothetical protein
LPDEFGITSPFLRFFAIFFKDAVDYSSNFRCDDTARLADLPVTGYDLFDRTLPDSLGAENILPDGVTRDLHFAGCLAIRSCSLIGFKHFFDGCYGIHPFVASSRRLYEEGLVREGKNKWAFLYIRVKGG